MAKIPFIEIKNNYNYSTIIGSGNDVIQSNKTKSIAENNYREIKQDLFQGITTIYYPFYELENLGLTDNIDHELFLKTFSLLSDNILIPPCHLFDTGLNNLSLLENHFSDFIEGKILTTSFRKGQTSLKDFVESKIESKGFIWSKDKKLNTSKVIDLYSKNEDLIIRDTKFQSKLFNELILESLFGNNHLEGFSRQLSLKQIKYLKKEFENISNIRGYQISKSDLDKVLDSNKIKTIIEESKIKEIKDLINIIYFHCGGKGNNSFIGYSDYFNSSSIYKKILSDKEAGTSLYYDPIFYLNFLKSKNIIDDINDIKSLSFTDIYFIRNTTEFLNFKKIYKGFSDRCSGVNNLQLNDIELFKAFDFQKNKDDLNHLGIIQKILYIIRSHNKIDKKIFSLFRADTFLRNLETSKVPLIGYSNVLRQIIENKKNGQIE